MSGKSSIRFPSSSKGAKDGTSAEPGVPSNDYGADILGKQDVDPALTAKMFIVNNAIDEIGWTPYHWKLFALNGFGYAVDSLLLLLQSVISTQAGYEFTPSYPRALTISVYVGMLFGALFWGLSADIIGRRFAFNVSLFICSLFTIFAGTAPHWSALSVFIAFLGFGGGGNLIMDTTVFIELQSQLLGFRYLPSNKQWVLTWLAAWWGLGQAITGFIAWGFLSPTKWNCPDPFDKNGVRTSICTYSSNKGWRYVMYTSGALVLLMSVARITVIRLRETPKYLLGEGRDAQIVADFRAMARKYNRPCSITIGMLEACGPIHGSHGKSRFSVGELVVHFRGLFATRAIGLSTVLIWFSWALIGLAYPLFYVFLSSYLASRGADFGNLSTYDTWRNYALVNISGIPGPMLAGYMCQWRILGRKYTMVIGALITMAFFFAYTQVRTEAQNIGFSCAIAFSLNIYYGTLYAYTPEVLPSAHRATGNGVAVACNRIMGILSAVIATVANTNTPIPIYICAALYIAMAAVAASLPFEPFGKRSS